MDENKACQAGKGRAARPEEALFVHVKWETRSSAPLLQGEDISQAAYTAISNCARQFRCRTRAIGGTPDHIHAVFQFPASVPISVLVRQTEQASSEAVARYLQFLCGHSVSTETIWDNRHGLRTIGECELPAIMDYVQHQAARHAQGQTCEELERVTALGETRFPVTENSRIRDMSSRPYPTQFESGEYAA